MQNEIHVGQRWIFPLTKKPKQIIEIVGAGYSCRCKIVQSKTASIGYCATWFIPRPDSNWPHFTYLEGQDKSE